MDEGLTTAMGRVLRSLLKRARGLWATAGEELPPCLRDGRSAQGGRRSWTSDRAGRKG